LSSQVANILIEKTSVLGFWILFGESDEYSFIKNVSTSHIIAKIKFILILFFFSLQQRN